MKSLLRSLPREQLLKALEFDGDEVSGDFDVKGNKMIGNFTVVLTACNFFWSGETLTTSLHVQTDDKQEIYNLCKSEADITDDEVDTILVLRNGVDGPEVFHHWTAGGGDFEGL